MKSKILVVLGIAGCVFFTNPQGIMAQTAQTESVVIDKVIKEIPIDQNGMYVYVEGKEIKVLESKKEQNQVVMVPLRVAAEVLGWEVEWNGEKHTVDLLKDNQWTSIKIDENQYTYMQMAPFELEEAPRLIDNFTYVPISFFEKVLKANLVVDEYKNIRIVSEASQIQIEKLELKDEAGTVVYPMVKGVYGKLDAARMNEAIKLVADRYNKLKIEAESVNVSYEVTCESEEFISIVFKGVAQIEGSEMSLFDAVNFDVRTGEIIDGVNLIRMDKFYEFDDLFTSILKKRSLPEVHFNEGMKISFSKSPSLGAVTYVMISYIPNDYALTYTNIMIPLNSIEEMLVFAPNLPNYISINTQTDSSQKDTLKIDVEYPQIQDVPNIAVQSKINSVFQKVAQDLIEEGKKSEKELTDNGFNRIQTQALLKYEIKHNEIGILSVTFRKYLYTGGAHGMSWQESFTYDLNTGEELKLKDIFKDKEDYIIRINEKIANQIEEKNLSLLRSFETIKEDQDYYLHGEKVVIYFQPYDYTAYAYGIVEFPITIADILQE